MKPMTEQEARAALKAEMPWASSVYADSYLDGELASYPAEVCVRRGPLQIITSAPTLRAAVGKALKAWRATQKYVYTVPYSMKKGAKR